MLLSPIAVPLQSEAGKATNVSNVLGRTVPLNIIWDDFESPNWNYNYQDHVCCHGFWIGTIGLGEPDRGDPELLKCIATPDGGKNGSTRALEIRTNEIDSDKVPYQEDLRTINFEKKLGRKLTRTDQPVVTVRVWLPPFDQWGDYYKFGFRQEFIRKNDFQYYQYYASIFFVYDKPRPFFIFRIHPNLEKKAIEILGGPIRKPGWWTLAIAFDEKGVDYYYARPGVDIPTEEDKIFDTRQLKAKEDTYDSSMDKVAYSFFSLMYPETGNASPQFVIDDYEVWVVKDK